MIFWFLLIFFRLDQKKKKKKKIKKIYFFFLGKCFIYNGNNQLELARNLTLLLFHIKPK